MRAKQASAAGDYGARNTDFVYGGNSTALDQFIAAIAEAGLTPPKFIAADGKLHRFASNGKPRDDSGWYVFHNDGIPAGAFGCWRSGVCVPSWRADIGRRLSPQEEAAHRAGVEAMRREREAEDAKRKVEAREKAAVIWQAAETAPEDHPYLVKKGIKAHGLRVHGGALAVPMRDGMELHSLQFIGPEGEKRFLSGGRVSGCYLLIGKLEGTLCIAEGYATGASIHEATGCVVAVAFNAGNLLPVARTLRAQFPDRRLIVCADDDASTPGNTGLSKAREAAQAVGGLLAVPDFGKDRPERVSDFNDLNRSAGPEAVRVCIERAAFERTAGPEADGDGVDTDKEIARLAKLREINYERERKAAAKMLGIERLSVLDKLVKTARGEGRAGQGTPLELPEPELWPEPVDGAALIGEIEAAFKRYVVMPKDAAFTSALWVLHTYCFDAFTCTPRLAITAPEKRCGKTTLLDVIAKLVPRPLQTANITAPAVFRMIEMTRPALLIDEADTFFGENEDLRGILNSGHRAGGRVVRTVGDDHEPRAFATFSPVAIAQIGKLPGTLADRSIGIEMKRRTPSEKVARFQDGRTPELGELARKAARWVADNAETIRVREPRIPEAIYNRGADNWEPLLSIAEVAGDKVAERARQEKGFD